VPDAVTPDWVKHAIFYQIFPDRFARSERVVKPSNLEAWDSPPTRFGYKGGDLLGIVERLDYLQDLGVTALYLNPIFQSTANHRYHTHDYYRVDPLLGGDAALDELLDACKRREMRVVLDGVFNHASRGFFQFNDVLENGAASPWIDWFHFHEQPANAYDYNRPPGYSAWAGLHALPKLNTDNPQVREYVMQVGEHWMRKGIDGWRLDVPQEIQTPGFWQEFRQRIKRINADAYIVAEIWHQVPEWLQGDSFDATMNYPFAEAAIAFTAGPRVQHEMVQGRGYRPYPALRGTEYADRIDHLLRIYPWPVELAMLNLLDSHDTARVLTIAGGDRSSLALALLLLCTYPGAPSIYYGDEIGMTGGPSDELARGAFPWDRPDSWDNSLRQFTKDLIALRRAHAALRLGSYRRLAADDDTYAFARSHDAGTGAATLLVAVNVAETPRTVTLPLEHLATRTAAPATLFGRAEIVALTDDTLTIELPPRASVVLDASPI
jgi:glycosidase